MTERGKTWVIVLAGGEGSRLRSLTTLPQEIAIPKQFCSLRGGPSLLQTALQRGQAIAAREQICTIVAAQHRRWWQAPLRSLPVGNVIVEPQPRGTGIGILWSLLRILERDPEARIVLLPADHHVRHEAVLACSLRQAIVHLQSRDSDLLLLAVEPEEADAELGYIMPGFSAGHSRFQVARFIEKPALSVARDLINNGALCNTFITAAQGRELLQMFKRSYEEIVRVMQDAMHHDRLHPRTGTAAADLYDDLPTMDFSRDIIEGQEANLQVLAVPSCGWSDLGTPNRVAETLLRIPGDDLPQHESVAALAHLNLTAQFALARVSAGE